MAPSVAPTNNTAKVCPVIGTGQVGIAIWASIEVNAVPAAIRTMSVTMLREKRRSARVGRPYAMESEDMHAPVDHSGGGGIKVDYLAGPLLLRCRFAPKHLDYACAFCARPRVARRGPATHGRGHLSRGSR